MNLYIKKVKNTKGEVKEWLWVNFTENGKRFRKPLKLENTKSNYKKAKEEILPILKYKLLNKDLKKYTSKIPTVNEFIKTSFELNEGGRINSTIKSHKRNYNNHIEDIFGHKKLNEITSNEITRWQNDLQKNKKLAVGTIKKIRGLLYTMFEDAISEEIININPIKNVKTLKEKRTTKDVRAELNPFSIEEIEKILNKTKEQDRNLIAFLFFTGLRIGECIALKWEDINLQNKTINVRRQIVKGEIRVLKTDNSKRIIPIIDILIPFLENQFLLTGNKKSFIFLTKKSNKHYHDGGKIREQIWIKLFKEGDTPYRNLHQTRGTFISTLISNGEDINYVSKIAGHKNVNVTLQHYSEYIPKPNKNFGNCFDKVKSSYDTKLAPSKKEVI